MTPLLSTPLSTTRDTASQVPRFACCMSGQTMLHTSHPRYANQNTIPVSSNWRTMFLAMHMAMTTTGRKGGVGELSVFVLIRFLSPHQSPPPPCKSSCPKTRLREEKRAFHHLNAHQKMVKSCHQNAHQKMISEDRPKVVL